MRWNENSSWVWSDGRAHEALIGPELFTLAQELSKAAEHRPMAAKQRTAARRYVLSGIIACGICNRRMQASWNHEMAHYRCRFPYEYALANRINHPLTVYVREDEVVPVVDEWLLGLAAPEHVDKTAEALVQASKADTASIARLEAAQRQLADIDDRLARYRAALDAGADPAMVAGWMAEVQGERLRAKLSLDELPPLHPVTTEEAHLMLGDLRQLAEKLDNADAVQKAAFYTQLNLRMTYYPDDRVVRVSANPPHACATARVGGGTRYKTPRLIIVDSGWSELGRAA
jgi:site-specific DNA recombinase